MRCVLAFVVAVLTASTALAGGKPFPAKEQIDASKQLIAETFRKELAEPDKVPAVKAMLETAAKTEGDDSAQAALYLSAAEVAARIGDTRLAFQSVDQLAQVFNCDVLTVKQSLLDLAAKVARTNDARVSVANRGIELADLASIAGRFDVADDALKVASAASSKVRDAELRKQITAKRKDVEKARKQADHTEHELAAAKKSLNADQNDPAANEALGKHLCFTRNDWSTGLKHLGKSSDDNLRKLSLADM